MSATYSMKGGWVDLADYPIGGAAVNLYVNPAALCAILGRRALKNKNGRATMARGSIVVRVTKREVTP